jgi:hypothetical protein
MSDTLRYTYELQDMSEKVQSIGKLFDSQTIWKLDQLFISYRQIFDRFCPVKLGDIVILSHDVKVLPDKTGIPEGHGWYPYRHFLKAGSKAEVMDVGYSTNANEFTCGLHFLAESWIDSEGVEHLVERKSLFYFLTTDVILEDIDNK